jgi:beta-galactosidase
MVWEETPGWGFVGDSAWQQLCVQNVHDMIIRDRNRPSVIIWGTRVNEAPAVVGTVPLWAETRKLSYQLDGSRPSSGTMTDHSTINWAEDVYAMDDYSHSGYNAFLLPPIPNVPYLVTEAVGALDPPFFYQRTVSQWDQQHQAFLHAQVHSLAALNNGYAGLIAWCSVDYDSLSGNIRENLKWPGVVDTFRVPKPGAAMYRAQVSPTWQPVIEPSFYWDFGPTSPVTTLGTEAMIWSNCDTVEAYVGGTHYATLTPQTGSFPGLAHPPMYLDVTQVDANALPDLRLDGYVGSNMVLSRSFAGDPTGDHLAVAADDVQINADGSDATRVTFRAVDRYGAPRPYVAGNVQISVTGPAVLVGDSSFDFAGFGGVGGVWLRSLAGRQGTVEVTVTHPTLGSGTAQVLTVASAPLTPQAFTDIPVGYPAAAAIEALSSKGIVDGFGNGIFQPDGDLTRAQFVKMLDLTLGLVPGNGQTAFSDVPPAAWFAPYVSTAVQAGIVDGTSPTTFSPNGTLSRQELAVLLARALKLGGTTTLSFTDAAQIASWATAGVEAAVAGGYMSGFADGTFQPLAAATRAQASTALALALAQQV